MANLTRKELFVYRQADQSTQRDEGVRRDRLGTLSTPSGWRSIVTVALPLFQGVSLITKLNVKDNQECVGLHFLEILEMPLFLVLW